MRGSALALLLLAGCGADPVGEGNASTNQIERLSTPEAEPETDPLASARLQPLAPGDVAGAGLSGPGCRFSIGGSMVLAANESSAIARLGGQNLLLAHSAPVGPSGGFLQSGPIGISVGRTDVAETPERAMTGWPGRITVTNRRTGVQLRQDGVWRCGP